MPDTGFLVLSLGAVVLGTLLFLYPNALLKVSNLLNRTMVMLDKELMRYRYVVGLLAFAASYAFFKIALTLPLLRS